MASDHIDNIVTKINQRLGLLRRVKPYLSMDARCTLYTSLILPLLDYADRETKTIRCS